MRSNIFGVWAAVGCVCVLLAGCQGNDSEPRDDGAPPPVEAGHLVETSAESNEVAVPSTLADEDDFQLTVTLPAGNVAVTVFFHDGMAFAQDGATSQLVVVYDLVEMKWFDVASGNEMTHVEAEGQLDEARARVRDSLVELPEGFKRRMVAFLTDPEFEIEEDTDRLFFKSEFGEFTVDVIRPAADRWSTELRAYNRMSSGWMLVTKRGAPDLPVDAIVDHLAGRGLLPTRIANDPSPATGMAKVAIELGYEPLAAEITGALDEFYAAVQEQSP